MSKPRNKFEKKIYGQLKRNRIPFHYEHSKLSYIIAAQYLPDFEIDTPTGKLYVECKGYFRPEDKRKLLAVRRMHPEIDLRILFYAANKKNEKWATKNGIRYAISTIPKEWLSGL